MHLEVLALLFLGLVGYFVGACECTRYFRGYAPALREAAIENERALAARKQIAQAARTGVQLAVKQAHGTIDSLREVTEAWVQRIPAFREEAAGIEKEGNRCCDAAGRLLANVCAEYADGYHEVRAFDRTKAIPAELAYQRIEVPVVFDSACDAAVTAIQGVSGATTKAHLDLDRLLIRLITRVDEWAGVRPANSNLSQLSAEA
jgi:hypothetical protein